MKTQDRTIRELLDNFDLFFRIEDDGSIHLKDYKTGKYAIYDWIVDSLYKVSELKQPEKQEIEKLSHFGATNEAWLRLLTRKLDEVIDVVNKLLKEE